MLFKSLISLKNKNIESESSLSFDSNKNSNQSLNLNTYIKSTSSYFTRPNFINF
ncbi:hypothetical protein RB653_002834 [Dictyostelium firmibasis]|uniref:Uncharacterized protein n=1 Tax=Dictyostelium firmibasis TaxID=79012 RepID=A0AAN7TY33_9MYCE